MDIQTIMAKKKLLEKSVQNEQQTKQSNCRRCKDTGINSENEDFHGIYGNGPGFCGDCEIGKKQLEEWKGLPNQQLRRSISLKEKYEQYMEYGELPHKFERIGLDDIGNEKMKGILEKYILDFRSMVDKGHGFYFRGEVGTGKTFALCVLICELLLLYDIRPTFVNLVEYFSKIKSEMKYEDSKYSIERLKKKQILFIDDLGMEKGSERVIENIYELINYRYENKMVTVISSNQSLEDLSKHYNKQISSRIIEMCKIIKLTGTDKRLNNKPTF